MSRPPLPEGAKIEPDQHSARLYNTSRFSDLLIKFSGREIKAHRFVLCEKSKYFDKLCGPESPFQEARQAEIELHEDDADALEAMLRHLYNFLICPPRDNAAETFEYYLKLLVVSDKYDVPTLAGEVHRLLRNDLAAIEDIDDLNVVLRMLVEVGDDIDPSLGDLADKIASARLAELSKVASFKDWLAKRPCLLQQILDGAVKLKSMPKREIIRCGGCRHETPGEGHNIGVLSFSRCCGYQRQRRVIYTEEP